ncbi:hypothetical protein RHMOL_Rhmol05G0286600 [Rhododendron molle]|uniref:Uncharacterized protein n=1 Tax=Rhododendron molle TaxID=49168 RepID=A0ACC0NWG9_RHOML|nr:hypothetical protein RHMOL_Rhmol05G0286600 [Rhododendron molle]
MGSSDRLFNRQRTVHEILGGGLVGILLVTLAVWLVFEKSGYTLLSLVSSVLLLLLVILFLWAKSAELLNRPPPPLPDLCLSGEVVNEIAGFIHSRINALLSTSKDIALGKDTRMFFRVAAYLCVLSVVGGFTDFLTLGYTSLLVILTIPALYEKYEDDIDRYILKGCRELQHLCVKFDAEYLGRVRKWVFDFEKQKLS